VKLRAPQFISKFSPNFRAGDQEFMKKSKQEIIITTPDELHRVVVP